MTSRKRLKKANLKSNVEGWTDGRYRSFITSALRGAMRRYPPKWQALEIAFVGVKINKKTGRQAKHYQCASCGGEFTSTNVQVDHIIPIGSCDTWDEVIANMFCTVENLQVLCITCHAAKTKKERQQKKKATK